jgi:hypothetical protein
VETIERGAEKLRYRHQIFSAFSGSERKTRQQADIERRTCDGIVFDSYQEVLYYKLLMFQKKKFLRQVPVDCVVHGVSVTIYKFDFLLLPKRQYVEVKGYWEEQAKIRFKLAMAVLQQPVIVRTFENEHLVRIKQNGRLECLDGQSWRAYKWGEK